MAGGKKGGVDSVLGRALGRLAASAYRRRWVALLIATAALIVAGWAARGLSVDTDLTKLLPRSVERVRSLDELEKRSWGVGYVAVVARGAAPDTLRQVADDLAPQLEKLSTIHYGDYRPGSSSGITPSTTWTGAIWKPSWSEAKSGGNGRSVSAARSTTSASRSSATPRRSTSNISATSTSAGVRASSPVATPRPGISCLRQAS